MKKLFPINLKRLFFLTFVILASQTHAQQADESLQKLAQDLKTTMLQCPERLWPDYSWKGTSVFLIKNSQNKAYLFSEETPQLSEVSLSLLPPNSLTSIYSFFEFQNRPALGLDLDQIAQFSSQAALPQLMGLAVHEFFHYHGQKTWPHRAGQRGTDYPLSATPRLYRRMIFENLKTYFLSSGIQKEPLQKAAYWFQKWVTEYPSENLNTTDGYEGTARYMELLAANLAKVGCQASDLDLFNQTKSVLFENMGHSVAGLRFALDSEGYDLGGLSALILRLLHHDVQWYQDAKNQGTPLESLLSPVTPLVDTIPDSISQTFLATEKLENARLAALVDQDIANYKDPEFIRFLLPSASLTSTYSPLAFLKTIDPPLSLTPMGSDLAFVRGQTAIKTKKFAVAIRPTTTTSPCQGQDGWMFLVHKSQISHISATSFSIDSPLLQGQTVGEMKLDAEARTWLCPTPQ